MTADYAHKPALVQEILMWLEPVLREESIVVDCTLGGGGHAQALLERAPGARLVCFDRDPSAIEAARDRLARFLSRTTFICAPFSEFQEQVARVGVRSVSAVLYDLGVASPQLDVAARGFSFSHEGPLDMRMDPRQTLSADSIVNAYDQDALARIIARYGEERFARRIARSIVLNRPIVNTVELAEIVKRAIPAATRRTGRHPARRTFQALRVVVNDELSELKRSLPQAIDLLSLGGRVAVISYHSLEDRFVKRTFRDLSRDCVCPPSAPYCICSTVATLEVLTNRAVRPSADELKLNPRAEAAKLRVAQKIAVGTAA